MSQQQTAPCETDWRRFFPYSDPRPIQAEILSVLQRHWNDYDVFCVSAPTAFGKTALARTLLEMHQSAVLITPTNILVQQYREEFGDTRTLSRLDSYRCADWQVPCSVTRGRLHGFCKGCPAGRDLANAKYRRGPLVLNYHMYAAQKLFRDVLVVDEAHNLLPFLRERTTERLWQHKVRYPNSAAFRESPAVQLRWLHSLPAAKLRTKGLALWQRSLQSTRPTHVVSFTTAEYHDEELPCIEFQPVSLRDAPPVFWPRDVQKIVLLSATISEADIRTLGLDRKRVLHLDCASPIPAERRPIICVPVTPVTHDNLPEAARRIAEFVDSSLLPLYPDSKGILHATYELASLLRGHLRDPRYMFHDRGASKAEQLRAWMESPPEAGRVLIASGMYEGLDLHADLGRWQVLCKVPWPSLGDAAVRWQLEADPAWYTWETLRIVLQASGRICRSPDDLGHTYILDSSAGRLFREAEESGMMPGWYRDGLEAGEKLER